jgi:hypothetical protein
MQAVASPGCRLILETPGNAQLTKITSPFFYFILVLMPLNPDICNIIAIKWGTGSVVVKALCYKPESRGLDSRWGKFLNLPNPSGRTRPWGLFSI